MLIADAKTAEARLKVCNACRFLSGIRQCKRCWCFVDAKVRLANAACPLAYW